MGMGLFLFLTFPLYLLSRKGWIITGIDFNHQFTKLLLMAIRVRI